MQLLQRQAYFNMQYVARELYLLKTNLPRNSIQFCNSLTVKMNYFPLYNYLKDKI